jgi:hypothetical protein
MAQMRLIHPIYLDVPMLVSFSAAIQGGLSVEAEVTQEKESTKAGEAKISGKFGLNNLFKNLFDITAETDISGSASGKNQETRRESKSHTEASIAILLYDHFLTNKGYLTKPQNTTDLSKIDPGTLVEFAGTLEKNAIDTVIDYIDAVNILSNLGDTPPVSQPPAPQRSGKKNGTSAIQTPKLNQLEKIRETLDKDRKRTPISNVILKCDEPSEINVVVTLRTANLRDLTLTELHKNRVRVVGKITRIISDGQSMSAFENYGMALLKPEVLNKAFDDMIASKDIVAEFSAVEVKGPAVQILPLMIFV